MRGELEDFWKLYKGRHLHEFIKIDLIRLQKPYLYTLVVCRNQDINRLYRSRQDMYCRVSYIPSIRELFQLVLSFR